MSLITKVRGVLWDAGGVIYSFDQSICDRKLAVDCGRTEQEVTAIIFGSSASGSEYNAGLVDPFVTGHITPREFYDSAKKCLSLRMSYADFVDAWTDIFTVNKVVADYIVRLSQRKVPQGVISSINVLHWEKIKSLFDLESLLGRDKIVLTCDRGIGVKKPHKKLFTTGLVRLGTLPEETVYADDVRKYVDAAIAYGLVGVHVDNSKPDFQERVVAELNELGLNE